MFLRQTLGLLCLASAVGALAAPSDSQILERYRRAEALPGMISGRTANLNLRASWVGSTHFFYRSEKLKGAWNYVLVTAASGKKEPAFDHAKLAANLGRALNRELDPEKLNLQDFSISQDLKTLRFQSANQLWTADRISLEPVKAEAPAQNTGGGQGQGRGGGALAPDRSKRFRVNDGFIEARLEGEGQWVRLSDVKGFETARWSPDSKHLVGFNILPGDRKMVHRLQSNLPGTRSNLLSANYDQPGDKMDTAELYLFDFSDWKGAAAPAPKKVDAPPFFCTQYPYHAMPSTRWWKDGRTLIVENPVRGYQAIEIWTIDPSTAAARIAIKEESKTFVDIGKTMLYPLAKEDAFIWRSESSGWSHLYKVDAKSGERKAITSGQWVVRSLGRVDEEAGTIEFTANGRESGDPYHLYHYRIKMDGTGLVNLTPGQGTHTIEWSGDRRFYVDTYSSLDKAPVHELRRANGTLVTLLERADVSGLAETGVKPLMPFSAKGRDGVTDIWGAIAFPTDFDPAKKYPVVENIYAGPHDSHVPKRFFSMTRMHQLAELGFIVVQIDGMGTSNRGKAFHDVAWQNLADAGFPDRIAWMKAAAVKFPAMDLERVGVYGTSAGGQNAAGAVLFHPEFYKAAVASCGCHDNRIDKQWWNEQWMGNLGPHYEANSNITHAAKLKGRLLLMVGEIDSNVPPESTFKFADALIKERKDFDFVILPGADHTDGGEFGERKRRDFFVKWLLGVDPPSWNEVSRRG